MFRSLGSNLADKWQGCGAAYRIAYGTAAGALRSAGIATAATPAVIELDAGARRRTLARRYRPAAAVVVKAAIGLAADPAGLDVLHQQRAGAVFRVGQA